MTRRFQRLAIIGSLVALLGMYLYHVPNSEGVAQMDRIRLLSASMKIANFISVASETLGIAPRWYVQRNSGVILKWVKPVEKNEDLKIVDTTIEGVPVRIYSPLKTEKKEPLPAVIYYHGGAFYMGSIETHHPITRNLARKTGFIVISVDYRLAPEHPFPAGVDDCLTVTKHILNDKNAQKFNIDPKRVAISGDSAGGNFAAVIAMRLVNDATAVNLPRAQLLIYPVVQFFDMMLPSYLTPVLHIFHFGREGEVLQLYMNRTITGGLMVNNHTNVKQKKLYRPWVDWSYIPEKYRQIYKQPIADQTEGNVVLIKNAKDILHRDVSPLLVDDQELSKLPSTYVLTVDHDRLRDEGFIYAGRLKSNGVKVVHRHFENTFHGSLTFLEGLFELDIAHQMLDDIVQYLKDTL